MCLWVSIEGVKPRSDVGASFVPAHAGGDWPLIGHARGVLLRALMATTIGGNIKRKIDIILPLGGKFVPLYVASGRHRATYLAEYRRLGKMTHSRWILGTGHWALGAGKRSAA